MEEEMHVVVVDNYHMRLLYVPAVGKVTGRSAKRPGSGKANSNTMRRVSKFSTNKSRIMSIVKPSIINDQRSTKILLLPVSRECGTTGERNDHSSFIAHKSGAVVREINTSIMISIVDYYVALFAAFVVPRF